jgi:hypothetical protein
MPDARLPVIDMHTHLAGLGHGGTGCFIAPRKFRSLLFSLLRWRLGLRGAERRGRRLAAPLDVHVPRNNARHGRQTRMSVLPPCRGSRPQPKFVVQEAEF